MSGGLQQLSEASLAAAEVERQPARRRQQLLERGPVEPSEVHVVPRRASPGCPLDGTALPRFPETIAHGARGYLPRLQTEARWIAGFDSWSRSFPAPYLARAIPSSPAPVRP